MSFSKLERFSRGTPFPASRFLSADECQALIKRVAGFADGGGTTTIFLDSAWSGNLRWARNRIISSGDVRNNRVTVQRTVNDATGVSATNALDDRRLALAVRRAERVEEMQRQVPAPLRSGPPFIEPYPHPKIWFESTYQQTADERAALMESLVKPAQGAGMIAAGYIEVSAIGHSSMDGDRVWYYPFTEAQYSVTVRDPEGTGSGWAGVDWNDWNRIDTHALTQIALDKCLRSRNPVRLEPGRYTTILEPQAVGDLITMLFGLNAMGRLRSESGTPMPLPFWKSPGFSKLGDKVIDERLSVTTDCMDPDLGFAPFDGWQVYSPSTWIRNGVLTELAYQREYAVQRLGQNTGGKAVKGSYFNAAYHMSVTGPTASLDEMIATTKRGVYVTRFWGVQSPPMDSRSYLTRGFTRDGTWLIENGKISKPIKNFGFTESPIFVLNNIEQVGVPQRIFSPKFPVVVPALKVRDFSFTSLSDAV